MTNALAQTRSRLDTRMLVILAVSLPVTLWIADQIDMPMAMAALLWLIVAARAIFVDEPWVARGTLVAHRQPLNDQAIVEHPHDSLLAGAPWVERQLWLRGCFHDLRR